MTTSITSRFLALAAVAAFTIAPFSEDAFSQRGRGGASVRRTSRAGPASRGSVRRSSKQSSPKRVDARDHRDDRRVRADDKRKDVRQRHWVRRRNGRRIAASRWTYRCTKSLEVDGATYRYCDGTWWEKVMDGSRIYWVEVEKP